MKKTAFKKTILLVVILVLAVVCLAACNNKAKSYTVTFKDGETVLGTLSVQDGKVADLSVVNYPKDGYDFVGWYTDAALTTPFVLETEVNGDLTLYAKYAQKSLYITVKSNGGSAVDRVPVTTGASYTVPVPTRDGYTFAGYTYENDEGEDVAFPTSGTYQFATSVRLTAHWTINVYTVNFHNGEVVTPREVEYDRTVVLPVATKDGYTFVGWFEDGATEPFAETTHITANLDLYACFTANQYSISFNVNSGSAVADYTATYGEAYTLTAPTREGYTFAGYTLDGEAFALTGTYQETRAIRLVATWTLNTYSVTFKTADEQVFGDVQTVDYNTYAQAPVAAAGYEIEGIYLNKEFTGDKVNLATLKITENKVFFVNVQARRFTITVINYSDANCEVAYGSTYTLPTKAELEAAKAGEWLSFDGYTLAGEAFEQSGTFTWLENITVVANYTRDPMFNKSNVTLLDGSRQIAALVVDDGTAVDLSSVNTAKTGYIFVDWYSDAELEDLYDQSALVNDDITLYAKYTAQSFKITFNTVGGNTIADLNVNYDSDYNLPDAVKRGYTFDGWTLNDVAFAKSGKFVYTENINLVATYTRNQVRVHFLVNGASYGEAVVLNQYDTLAASLPANPVVAGYTFGGWSLDGTAVYDANAEIEGDLELSALLTANVYQITIEFGDGTQEYVDVTYNTVYDLTENSEHVRDGYDFVRFLYNSNPFALSATYSIDGNITLTVEWEENADHVLFQEKTTYFREREDYEDNFTYVFLTGVNYSFGTTAVSTTDGASLITVNSATSFTAKAPGSFTLTIQKEGEDAYTRQAKIVNYVNTIGYGSDFSSMITSSINERLFKTTVATNAQAAYADYIMDVGISNYLPDISVKNDKNASISLSEANMQLEVRIGSALVDSSKYSLVGGAINFDDSLVGDELYVTFVPKYALSRDNLSNPTLRVRLNRGVNVYTNLDMKAAYSNGSVSAINVLRNITAELVASDYITELGGTLANQGQVTLSDGTTITVDTGTPYNDFRHSVYTRITPNPNDKVVINGNWFTVDGSKLPYIDNSHDEYGEGGSKWTSGDAYRIANVQIGLFLYRCSLDDPNGSLRLKYATGQATMKNLRLEGNNLYGAEVTQDLGDGGLPILKMSASYIGIVVRGGTMNIDNVSIVNTCMGFMLHGAVSGYDQPGMSQTETTINGKPNQAQDGETQATKLYMQNSIIDNSWANSIYYFDLCVANIKNSKMGKSSGAAIIVDDRPYNTTTSSASDLGFSNLDCELYLDIYTAAHIESWIAGDEAWFTAYGFSEAAALLKSQVDSGVKSGSNNVFKLIKEDTNGREFMNFAILAKRAGSSTDGEWADDNHGGNPYLRLQVVAPGNGFNWFYGDVSEQQTVGTALTVGQTKQETLNSAYGAYAAAQANPDATNEEKQAAAQAYQAAWGDYKSTMLEAGRPYVYVGPDQALGMVLYLPVYFADETY